MSLEALLQQTKFKKDAKEIARQFSKRGIDSPETLDNAPTILGSTQVWGYDLYEVIGEIRKAAEAASRVKPVETKPLETPAGEPGKPVGGIK